jgi:hypothetical protein
VIGAIVGSLFQLAISVSAPETLTVRQPATIVVTATASGLMSPTIVAPLFAPLSGVRSEESTQIDQVNGASRIRLQYRYIVVASGPGTVTLRPFEARLSGEVARSAPTRFVIRALPPATTPSVVARASIDTLSGVNFHALVTPDTVYVGQQATYQVGVFLSDDVRYRLRRNPEFVPPELRSMLAYDLALPGALTTRRQIGARRYDTHVFQRALFPLSAGKFVIPPARLSYSLPLSASFFSREESHSVKSESVALTVIDPPAAGRPAEYRGAVGQIRVDSKLESRRGRVGDPLVLTVRVDGAGNVNFFPRPALDVPWGQLVQGEERVRLDSTTALIRGTKEFDFVVTPVQSGTLQLPAIRYPYFNPYTERYELAVAPPQEVSVAPGSLAAADSAAAADTLPLPPLRAVRPATTSRSMFGSGAFWLVMALAPIPAAVVATRRRPRVRRERSSRAWLGALAEGKQSAPADLRRAYTRALVERIGVSSETLSDRKALVRALRRAGVSAEAAQQADTMLAELDAAVYAPDRSLGDDAARRALASFSAVDEEATPAAEPSPRRRAVPLAIILAATAVSPSAGRAQDVLDSLVARGTQAYQARHFGEAERWFGEATRLEPGSVDLWANFATAAWARGDTAAASIGWYRALRLDPLDAELRDHLEVIPGYQSGFFGDVPWISANVAAIAAAALWLVAWVTIALGIRRRPTIVRIGTTVGAVSLAVLLVGAWIFDRGRGEKLGIVVQSTRLRASPALAAEENATALTGELTRTVGEQGAWSNVRLSDGRAGWIETDRLERLATER